MGFVDGSICLWGLLLLVDGSHGEVDYRFDHHCALHNRGYLCVAVNSLRNRVEFFFVNPGVFLPQQNGDWLLLVTGENTHKPLLNVEMRLEDEVVGRAVPRESDLAKRIALIRAETIQEQYPEVDPTFSGGRILLHPLDVNNQEYSIQSTYRIGEDSYLSNEELIIVNVGKRFVGASHSDDSALKDIDWQFSVTVKNQFGEILVHCVDPRFPHDSRWIAGRACFPGMHYEPLPRSLCTRCFGWGFKFWKN